MRSFCSSFSDRLVLLWCILSVCICTIGNVLSVQAQTAAIDSLRSILQSSKPDTSKVSALAKLSQLYNSISIDTAQQFAKQALALATQINYERGIATAKFRLGSVSSNGGKIKEAIALFEEAYPYFERMNDPQNVADINNAIAVAYIRDNNYPTALQYQMKALQAYQSLGPSKILSVIYTMSDIGVVHRSMENDSLALSYYQQALDLYDKEIEGKTAGDARFKCITLINFGDAYMSQKRYAEAQKYFENALALSQSIDDIVARAASLENLGLIYLERGRSTEAIPKLQEALKIFKELGSKEDVGAIYGGLSKAYLNVGSTDLALYSAQQAISVGKEVESKSILREGYERLSEGYERMGDNTNALRFYRLATQYKDSIFREDNAKAISRIEASYELDKRRKENQLLQVDKEKQDATIKQQRAVNIAIGVGLFMVVILAIVLFRANAEKKRTNDLLSQQNEIIAEERQKSERLLLNILPPPIAERMKRGETSIAEYFPNITCIFSDIVGFTKLSQRISPEELVSMLDEIFSRMDQLADLHGVEKIKTIGDAYMVVSGLPVPREDHAQAAARMAISMQEMFNDISSLVGMEVQIRIGMHIGDAVAGIIGKRKFAYDLWGDTVNTASRMESHGEPGRVHCSETVYEALKYDFDFEDRGLLEVKGKGPMRTYFLIGPKNQQVSSSLPA